MASGIAQRLGRLSFGGAGLGNLYEAISDEQARALLEAAWDCGIRYFDTAPHYGLGLSERRLGAFLADKPREEYVVSTKAGRLLVPAPETAGRLDDANHFAVLADHRRVWDFSGQGVRRGLDDSLRRLGLDSVDVLYLHDPEEHDLGPALESGIPALTALRDEGAVAAIGVGSKSTKALLAGARSGALDLLMVAGRFTLLEQPALDEVLPECRARSVAVANAAVFNSGVLSSPAPRAGDHYEYGPVPPDVLARAREIAAVCADFGVDLPTAALHYSLREPVVRTVVAGGATPAQIRENHRRMHTSVPGELWDALRDRGLTRL
ncbi:aldo/keto reductase [Qaidamihabitans albus]|uniref:aldo/keto reductase n=1 Tax=Qaidamihabitans albus TaxID=2795733 RepID=UPI0018F17ED6|nr:aldo/keto reductase [Qaidamihabitans albus]